MIRSQPWEPLLNGLTHPTICLDGSGLVLYGNEAACRLLGRAPAELAGRWLRQLLADLASFPGFAGKEAPPCELTLLRKDGHPVRTECTTLSVPDLAGAGMQCLVLRERPGTAGRPEPAAPRPRPAAAPKSAPRPDAQVSFLLQAAPVSALYWNRATRTLEVNDALLALLGYSRAEFAAARLSWDALTAPEWSAADGAAFGQLAVSGQCAPYEKELLHKDGSRVLVQCACSLPDPADAGGILAFLTDLRAQRRAENELHRSRERFDILLQATRDGIWERDFVTGDSYCSPRWFDIQGLPESGEGPAATFDGWLGRVHPDYKDYVQTRLQLHLDKGLPFEVVYLHRHESGEYRWQRCSGQATWGPDGKPLRMAGTLSDIMHQKLVEEEVLREKEMSDSIINSLPGIFYLINEAGQVLRWNGNLETVTGLDREELSAAPLPFIELPTGLSPQCLLSHVFAQGEMMLDAMLRNRSGELVPYYFYGVVIRHEDRPHLVGMAIDMSVQRKTEKLLTESVAQIRELASHLQEAREAERSAMAHEIHDELGQSLTAVKMDLARMLRHVELPDSLEPILSDAVATIDSTISSVRRIASDLRPRLLDDLGLADAIDWYAESFARRSELQVSCSIDCPGLKVDAKTSIALFRILQESLTNVQRHACARSVSISLSRSGGQLTLTIADDGQGFRLEEARKKHTLGVLGLKERTLTLGGSFCVSSAPGAGTRIQVQVPIN